ncbi:MAG TPA: SDR family NAD(P)-dependent oxidoreductase [Anaeromyxobacteraceae bacterium]|nr:SDR family NAD(P)-dependent oxidoreductase [Anaeromyxobacteraceae bacterium]
MSRIGERYGPWALVAGASAGLGEAFARRLAAEGLHLLLVARRGEALAALAADLRARHGVEVRHAALDLASPELGARVASLADGAEVGLLVYNAAHSAIGPFVDRPLEEQLRVLDVNCRGPLVLSHLLGRRMAERGRGGILLMASLAGSQGGPLVASYAASKAFNLVLAEGLWDELGRRGVDVLACRAGATRTPGYAASNPKRAVPTMDPGEVVQEALAAMGRGPSVVAGTLNKFAAFLFARLLPRRTTIRIMGSATRRLYG